jgi:predicted nucleic acid-binding protein
VSGSIIFRCRRGCLGTAWGRPSLAHPFVIGEVALGKQRRRTEILGYLQDLPQARVATDLEVFAFIEQQELSGSGIGHVGAHLLASTRLTLGASLWTRDPRLLRVAEQLGLAR